MSPVHQRLTDAMRAYRREGAKLAAMILVAEPDRLGDMPIVDFLRQIPYLRGGTIEQWLAPPERGGAGIYALRPGNRLTPGQRRRLAVLLANFAKGER